MDFFVLPHVVTYSWWRYNGKYRNKYL